ncbi:pyridoxamine 5'-phosphate oxidase family protein [Nocardioides sp.]|uniref:pyridoxamine 5'-phosphate oxidase family protein n=1 Tax=Nocardioides sp. TaxID=35761 RepID=UPI00286A6F0F|nr:pyridoxamine 5'-phosphate oxidase family protein [Nocardioides sp.]
MPYTESPVRELSVEECWSLLDSEEIGRLAYRLVDEIHVVPLNYVVDQGELLFRTTPGNKLFAAALHSEVAFEIDWFGDDVAWSVVARGRMRVLDEVEEHRVDTLPLRPWVATLKYDVVGVRPEVVTGRTFTLDRSSGDGSGGSATGPAAQR